jgi:hypothetical protein
MVLIPKNIKYIAVMHIIIPNASNSGYKGCSLFLNEKLITDGPIKIAGIAQNIYLIPLDNISLLVAILA